VIQHQRFAVSAAQTRVFSHHCGSVERSHGVSAEAHVDALANKAHWHRVEVLPHAHPRFRIDSRAQQQSRVKWLSGQVHADELTAFATSIVGPHDAPDVVSAAVIAAFSSPGWHRVENQRAYLYRTVYNESLRITRRRSERTKRERLAAQPQDVHLPDACHHLRQLRSREHQRPGASSTVGRCPDTNAHRSVGTADRWLQLKCVAEPGAP